MNFTARSTLLLDLLLLSCLLSGGCVPQTGGEDASATASAATTTATTVTTGDDADTGATQATTGTTANLSEIMGDSETASSGEAGSSGSTGEAGSSGSSGEAGSSGSTGEAGSSGTDTTGDPVDCGPTAEPKPVSMTPCESEAECGDGEHCDIVPLIGGACGECTADADCAHGCTHWWAHDAGSTCNSGELGAGCESDAVCQACAPHCALILEVFFGPGQPVPQRACSECVTNQDCPDGQACAVELVPVGIAGANRCVVAGSLAIGEDCRLAPGGEVACASGKCGEVNNQGIFASGVCSECATDGDCDPGESCVPGHFEGMELILPHCAA